MKYDNLSFAGHILHQAKLKRKSEALAEHVGKQVNLELPRKLKSIVNADTGTLVSSNGSRAIVRVGKAFHTVDERYVKPC